MLIVAGHLIVDGPDRDQYVADCAIAVRMARAADGCLDFAVSADPVDPRRVNIFERWQSAEQLQAFRGSGPDDDTLSRIVEASVSEYPVG
jgi:quinol monooxygenase YgiN